MKAPSTWKAQIQEFCHHYARDLPNVIGLPAELDLWQRIWTEKKEKAEDIPEKIASTLKSVYPASFPNVFTILQILETIPVTYCSCERSISCLRYLKNYLRGTMGEERLNGLAIMHPHRDIPLDLVSTDDVMSKLNLLFAEICSWYNSNKLTLHTGKSKVMILRRNIFVGPLFPVQEEDAYLYPQKKNHLDVRRRLNGRNLNSSSGTNL